VPDVSAHDGGSPLERLAAIAGILREYVDQTGHPQHTSDETRRALLTALGHDVADDAAAARSLDAMVKARRARPLAPVHVASDAVSAGLVVLRVASHAGARAEWELRLRTEGMIERVVEGHAHVGDDGALALQLPEPPPLGYHDLRVVVRMPGGEVAGTQTRIVTPNRFPSPAALLRGQRVFGLTANLYTVRSARNWGVGDFDDLGALLERAAEAGAAFVGVNPLHALRNAGGDISPYSPVSRLFRNALYLDVAAVPEMAESEAARALVSSPAFAEALGTVRAARRVDYEAVMALKRPVLEALHATFRARGEDARTAAYRGWIARGGEPLERFARFCALDDHLRAAGAGWWREWPDPLQVADSPAVDAFAREHADRVDFHRWLQFELDRQLADAARRGRELGMPLGIYQDLAIGTSPAGSDVWASPELFVRGVSVGAPPDPLGPDGQNWGLPPLDPHRLGATGYSYWAALARSAMRHAGALRIDHVLGLFRQFWIPEGRSGRDGAYVRFPTEDLLGVLALEAQRAGALVVGEDLGTVPPEVAPTLARWGMLTSKVLYFERGDEGRFVPTRHYPRTALATANTHDLAPLAGWWLGRDLALRREVGLLRDDDELRDCLRERDRDRAELLALLVDEGILDPASVAAGPDGVGEADVRAAVHALLRRAPSWLVGISLDDLVGETEPVNVPGVGPDAFPSWTRRLAVTLEALRDDPAFRRALGAEREWVP